MRFKLVIGVFIFLAGLGVVSAMLDIVHEKRSMQITAHQLNSKLYLACTDKGKCLMCNDEGDEQLALMKCSRAVGDL